MSAVPPDAPAPTTPPLLPVPELDARWVHAGAQHLDLLPTPVTSASTTYKAFSYNESLRVDDRWMEMTDEERRKVIEEWGKLDGEGAPAASKKKEKEKAKEKEKEAADKGRRASVVSNTSLNNESTTHPVDEKVKSERANSTTSTSDDAAGAEEAVDESDRKYKDILMKLQHDYEDLESVLGVPVSQDSLFEVSLPTLSLHPVFWAHTGPRVAVLRGTWFASDDTRPCSWELAEEIEKGYLEIQPWQPSYKHELATAMALGPAGEEKLKYTLPAKFGQGVGVIFEDGEKGRLITTGTLSYLTRALWSSLRTKPSGTYVYRGYSAAVSGSGKEPPDLPSSSPGRSQAHSRRGSSSSQRSFTPATAASRDKPATGAVAGAAARHARDVFMGRKESIVGAAVKGVGARAGETIDGAKKKWEGVKENDKDEGRAEGMTSDEQKAHEEENAPVVHEEEDEAPCTDLILVLHGIGQQLAAQYEAYNFVYAGNQLRQVLRKQATNPALASIMRNRRCQILPVQWRASLNLDDQKTEEEQQHGMDNRFTINDITINKSIPYVRELTNAVLLDIPLFMSHHRQKMIEAVCTQANKLYRLWVARNPEFEKNGRVHIIGHSLGSALVAHILSNQPTKMPDLSQLPKQVKLQTKDRFLFNTSNLFLCGSPLGIFLHLDQAQLMPRKGRDRTMSEQQPPSRVTRLAPKYTDHKLKRGLADSPQDEAMDRAGRFGCMAIDSLYNVFYHTDPVAYQLNAAVDSKLAAQRSPLAITSVTAPFYAPVADGISSISKYLPTMLGGGGGGSGDKKAARPGVLRLPSGIEMTGPNGEERLEGTRGERRFSALNPHGNVDFYLPSIGVNEYLDMITAHLAYWTDPSFAAFLLAEIFSTRLDLMRTGMGLEQAMSEMAVA